MAESRADFAIGSADLPLPSELSTASRLHTSYIYSHHRKRCKVDEHSVTVVVLCNLCVFSPFFSFFLGGCGSIFQNIHGFHRLLQPGVSLAWWIKVSWARNLIQSSGEVSGYHWKRVYCKSISSEIIVYGLHIGDSQWFIYTLLFVC